METMATFESTAEYIKTLDLESIAILLTNYRNNIKTASNNIVSEPVTDEDFFNNELEKEILDESLKKLVWITTAIKDVLYPVEYVEERGM